MSLTSQDPSITNYVNSSNVMLTLSSAALAGYAINNAFAPAGPSSVSVNAGTNLTSSYASIAGAASDIKGVPRPATSPWDAGAYEYTSIGDVSGNGAVTEYDAALLLRDLAEGGTCSTLTAQQCANAQMDGQGYGSTIDSTDVVAIARKAAGL